MVNMPASYVLAPNDLICVPVTQTLAPTQINPQWTSMKPTPPKPAPKPSPKPKLSPAAPQRAPKPKPRTRPLVDFINNFRDDAMDVESEPVYPRIITPTPRPTVCYQPRPQPPPAPSKPSTLRRVRRAVEVLPQPPPPPPPRLPEPPMVLQQPPQLPLLTISMPSLDSPPICDKSPSISMPCLSSPPVQKISPRPVPPPPTPPPPPVTIDYPPLSTCDPLPAITPMPVIPAAPTRTVSPPPPVSPLMLEPPRLRSPSPPPPPVVPLQPVNDSVQLPENHNNTNGNVARKLGKEFKITPRPLEPKSPQLVYDVVADDGVKFSSTSLTEVWKRICESVQEVRAAYRMPHVPVAARSYEILGLANHGVQHLLEQLPGVGFCKRYQPKFFNQMRDIDDDLTPVKENVTGCARSERFAERKEVDKFGWLASRHRKVPRLLDNPDEPVTMKKTNHLPMAMRYRALRESKKSELFVYRSKIHGMGLFCTREIDSGEMVIEYTGELIRSCLSDKREKYYTDRGIGCYMFRIDDHFVIDATLSGNSARFINHSCEPNCFSRVVDILGRKHIIIFALRRIAIMEELTYDYKFPFEDVKISCHCQSKKCRKYLN